MMEMLTTFTVVTILQYVCVCQIIMLYTLSLNNVMCQLHFNIWKKYKIKADINTKLDT